MLQSTINNSACNRQSMGYGEDFYFGLTGSNPQNKINYNSNMFEVAEVSQRYEEVSPLFLSTCEDCEIYGTEKNKTGSLPQSKRNYTIEKNNNIYYSNTGNSIEVAEVSQQTDTQLKEDLYILGCEGFISKYGNSYDYYDTNAQFNEEGYCINEGDIYTIKRIVEKQYNPTTGKNEIVPSVIKGDIRFKVMYNFILARRVMKRNVTFGCLLFNAVKDSVMYLDNSDNLITPLSIISRVEKVMNLTDEQLDNSHINPDSRHIITDPTKTNRKQTAQKGRRAVVLSQRNKMYDPTLTDRENALKMGVCESSVRNYRNNANLTSCRDNRQSQREIDILTYYNPTESINANFKRMKAMGLDIALSSLKRYVKSHRDELFNAGNVTETHQTLNNAKPIQITTPTMKTQYNANMKEITNLTESDRSIIETPQPPTRSYTEEEQRLMDDLNKRYMDYYNAQNTQDDEEPTEDEKNDCGASGEVWNYEESETWREVYYVGLKEEYRYMFKDMLTAVAEDNMNEFNDRFDDFIVELTEYCYEDEERKLERVMNVLLDEIESLGYYVENKRDALRFRNFATAV